MTPKGPPLMVCATGDGLPKSNQEQRQGVSDVSGVTDNLEIRRAIPPAAQESSWRAADGHVLRRIDWADAATSDGAAPRGSILFFPGRGDNYEKYLETLEQWHRAGWRVTAADWRGQAGSGRLGRDAVTGHIGDFADWIADLAGFWRDWKAATPGPHVLAGHSMGGHLVLRGVLDGAADPDALILSAPMLGFVGPLPNWLGQGAAKMMCLLGDRTRQAWKWSEKPGEMPATRKDLLTHDANRYDDEMYWRETRPELVMGPGSWGWVERAYASIRAMFAGHRLEAVNIPVLILATSNDRLVSFAAIEDAARRMPQAQLVRFGAEAHHEILREEDAVRDRAMAATLEFLDGVARRK